MIMFQLKRFNQLAIFFCLFSFGFSAQASICIDIYNKVKSNGCAILKKVKYARQVCDAVNKGAKEVCVWCGKHPAVCIAIAGAILYAPVEEEQLLFSPFQSRPIG